MGCRVLAGIGIIENPGIWGAPGIPNLVGTATASEAEEIAQAFQGSAEINHAVVHRSPHKASARVGGAYRDGRAEEWRGIPRAHGRLRGQHELQDAECHTNPEGWPG
eukprot:268780-Amorphochlora_amoeboformis.AAC.3